VHWLLQWLLPEQQLRPLLLPQPPQLQRLLLMLLAAWVSALCCRLQGQD
jgi:hypothetical protein